MTVIDDGAEALAFACQEAKYASCPIPNLIVLDLNLPKYDGTEVLVAFRQNPAFTNIPVVVVTSSASPRDRTRIEELSVERFITKPPDLDSFLQIGAVIREIFQSHRHTEY